MVDNLEIKWTVSKARDTYGYNICTARINDKRYSCNGGGYDMLGTVVGMYLVDQHQDALLANRNSVTALHGAAFRKDKIQLDGAHGLECMLDIAKIIGLEYQKVINNKGYTTNILFSKVK